MGLSGLGRMGLERGGDVPGQEFFDSVDWMLGDRCQDRAQVEGGIEAVQLGCSDKAIERCSALAAGISSHEEVILASDGNSSQRPLGRVVIDFQKPIIHVACQRTPV